MCASDVTRTYLERQAGSDGEGVAEPLERELRVAGRPGLEPDGAAVAHVGQGAGDRRVRDLAGAGLAAPWHVRDLDLADPRQGPAAQLDEVPLADLCVVEVEHHAKVRAADRLDEREAVGRSRERH